MSESATPESETLTRAQAAELIMAAEQPPAPEAPTEAAEEPEDDPEGETSAPEDAEDGDETPAEDEEAKADTPAVEPAEPPKYWSQDAKAKFALLDPDLQAVVLAQEGPREEATAKAKAEAAEIAKQAQAEIGKVQQLAEALADRLPQWVQNFQSKWGTDAPDWPAYAQEHGVEAMTLAKAHFERDAQQLAEAAKATEIAETQAFQAYVKAEFARLQELAPELADPEKGPERRAAVVQYLTKQGIPEPALKHISAAEMVLARKAMLWDQAQTKLSAPPKPKPAAPAAKSSPVRPAAAAPQAPTPVREAAALRNRFAQTKSREDAAALIIKLGL